MIIIFKTLHTSTRVPLGELLGGQPAVGSLARETRLGRAAKIRSSPQPVFLKILLATSSMDIPCGELVESRRWSVLGGTLRKTQGLLRPLSLSVTLSGKLLAN